MALKGLGAKYPDAYQDFVRTLQPSQMAAKQKQTEIESEIIPHSTRSLSAPAPTTHRKAVSELADMLPMADVPIPVKLVKHSAGHKEGSQEEDSDWSAIESPVTMVSTLALFLISSERIIKIREYPYQDWIEQL